AGGAGGRIGVQEAGRSGGRIGVQEAGRSGELAECGSAGSGPRTIRHWFRTTLRLVENNPAAPKPPFPDHNLVLNQPGRTREAGGRRAEGARETGSESRRP